MEIINRVKFDGLANREWLVYKYPCEMIANGAQLIVGEGQTAVFMSCGTIADTFTPGTYTLNTQNLPILQNILNLPFGGSTPFPAEVFFFNNVAKLNITWGTNGPILLIDPKYSVLLHIRAFGSLGLRLLDCVQFLEELIGVLEPSQIVRFDKLKDYFKSFIVQKIKVILSDHIINRKISALEITPLLEEISNCTRDQVAMEFSRYGFDVVHFIIESINFPDEDFHAINKILVDRAEFDLMGDSRYIAARTFNVLQDAAQSCGSAADALMAGEIDVNVKAEAGIKEETGAKANTAATAEPKANAAANVKVEAGVPCRSCGKTIPPDAKFCDQCGQTKVPTECTACGARILPEARFCTICGTQV